MDTVKRKRDILIRAEIKSARGDWTVNEYPQIVFGSRTHGVRLQNRRNLDDFNNRNIRISGSRAVTIGRMLFDEQAPYAEMISRLHCRLQVTENGLLVTSFSKHDDKLIRGGRLMKTIRNGDSVVLREGDVLMLSGYGKLTFVCFIDAEEHEPVRAVSPDRRFVGWLNLNGRVRDKAGVWAPYIAFSLAPTFDESHPRQLPSRSWQFGRVELRESRAQVSDRLAKISEEHCTFTYVNDMWRVYDHSMNGTKVISQSGRIVSMERGYAELLAGMIIEIAGVFRFYINTYIDPLD